MFYSKDGEVFTPIPNGTFLNGLNRQRIIKLLRADGVKVHEVSMTVQDFNDANEIFVQVILLKLCRLLALRVVIWEMLG